MTIPAAQDFSLGFIPGDHVCAFYSSSRNVLDDIVVDYITNGLQAGNKVFCMVDQPSSVHGKVPARLVAREGMLCPDRGRGVHAGRLLLQGRVHPQHGDDGP